MNAKETLTNWLESNDTQRVLTGLMAVCKRWENNELESAVIFQTNRLNTLKQQQAEQTISHSDYQLESEKIRKVLLDLIVNLDDQWTSEELENIPPTKISILKSSKWKKWAAVTAGIIAVLGGIAEFSGYSIRDIFTGGANPDKILTPPTDTTPTNRTSGENSPIIIHNGQGDVNYNALQKENKDSLKSE